MFSRLMRINGLRVKYQGGFRFTLALYSDPAIHSRSLCGLSSIRMKPRDTLVGILPNFTSGLFFELNNDIVGVHTYVNGNNRRAESGRVDAQGMRSGS